ncbi:aimless RasGEF [Planoprotostelium fungivorum]|uniref:Aimless RasGEF n=1 Tax=Planoprotostelium fungivorum TaxID=1890364 RepID=A0A2P6NQ91_9EUKA|nr:aimless RasGEF [Planoprotostelium fungivorum]
MADASRDDGAGNEPPSLRSEAVLLASAQKHQLDNQVDRSGWLPRVQKAHPSVKEVRERVSPLLRALTFSEIYNPGRKDVRDRLSKEDLIQLIMQHLMTQGLESVKLALEKESALAYNNKRQSNRSYLVMHLNNALRDTEKVYDLAIDERLGRVLGLKKDRQVELEEHLLQVGIQEEEDMEETIDIWSASIAKEQVIEIISKGTPDEEKIVKAGTLNGLIGFLTSVTEHHTTFQNIFLLTYQSFTTPKKLFDKLVERYHVPMSFEADSPNRNESIKRIRLRVCSVIKKWLEEYSTDFNESLKGNAISLVQLMRAEGEAALANSLQNSISKMDSGTSRRVQNMKKLEPLITKNIFSDQLNYFDIEDEELARQMTLIDYEIFSIIKPEELLNLAWSKPKLKHKAKNVLSMIDRFNNVSSWVATMIISPERLKNRTKAITKFLKVAKHLRQLNNFNSLTDPAIIAAFNMACVHRLKHSWEGIPANIVEEIEKLMNTENGFKIYRDTLKLSSPAIPYLGVHLTDLTFMEENPDCIEVEGVKMINFAKRKLIYAVISLLQTYQQTPYHFATVHQITSYLKKGTTLDEPTLYRMSLDREPRKSRLADIQQ